MKKIMKKALSLVLVMAMMLVPMTTASAATNTDPSTAEQLSSDYANVTVGAGETLYYSYGSQAGVDQGLAVTPRNYEGSDFEVVVVYSGTGSYVVEALDEYDMGYGTASATLPTMRGGQVFFAIHNTGAEDKDFSVMLWNAEGTTLETASYIVDGKNVFNAYGGASSSALGNYYIQKDGTVTISMAENNEAGWKYSVVVGHRDADYNFVATYEGETHYCNETGDAYKPSETVSVSEGDYVYVWLNSYDVNTNTSLPGEVAFNVNYEATDKDPYTFVYSSLLAGENEIALSGLANVTLHAFSGGATNNPYSSTAGKYRITVPTGCTLTVWASGENWGEYVKETTVTGTTYDFDYEQNTEVVFGFEGVGGVVTIERTGDLDDVNPNPNPNPNPGNEYTNYVNTVSPVPYEFTGNVDNIFYVWVEGDKVPTAVLGSDGYYHLGSATGPVLYIDLNMDMHPYYTVAGLQAVAGEGRLYHYNKKIDYATALLTYAAFADTKTGYYPVTEDIKEIIVEYGDGQWWYNPEGPAYLFENKEIDESSMWLFMCCYEGVVDKAATDTRWTTDSKDGFVFKVNAEISDFVELKINDKVVDEEYYTLTEGSTIITVSVDYMKTLATGDYTVAATFYNSVGEEVSFTTELTVAAPTSTEVPGGTSTEVPSGTSTVAPGGATTGDSSNMALWFVILGLGVVAIAGSLVMKKRKF